MTILVRRIPPIRCCPVTTALGGNAEAFSDSIAEPSNCLVDLVEWRCGIRGSEEHRLMLDILLGAEPATSHH